MRLCFISKRKIWAGTCLMCSSRCQ